MDDAQRAALAAELAKPQYAELMASQRYAEIADLLNAQPLKANPTPITNKPRRVSFEEFIGVLTPADVQLLYSTMPTWGEEYRRGQRAGGRTRSRKLWNGAKRLAFNAATITAIDALQNATEPDPNYRAQIPDDSIATKAGLPRIAASDVQAVEQAAS